MSSSGSAFTHTPTDLLPIQAELVAREPLFHRPACAAHGAEFAAMMVPGYWETGASGRRYSRDFILRRLTLQPPVDADAAGWTVDEPQTRRLSQESFLLTYTLRQGARATRRATLWTLSNLGWQAVYHQGTVVEAEEDDTDPS